MEDNQKSREQVLEETLQRVLAELHDASQFRETPERRNRIDVTPLLEIIGDVVECPDCRYWDEHHDDPDLTDAEVAMALRFDREVAEEQEVERVLRQRP
jgi:hypothetical protein